MSTTRREKIRDITREEIKAIARAQMAQEGTTAINLRAIAREMEMTAPALYRYYASRDDLITALILDAYNSLGDAMEAAAVSRPTENYAGRMYAVVMTYRDWALAHPVDFQLIFGNPIPGYEAPFEITVAAARRSNYAAVSVLVSAMEARALVPPTEYADLPPSLYTHLAETGGQTASGIPPVVLYLSVVGWARMHGMIMLELFNHTQPVLGDTDAFYRKEALHLINSMGLKGDPIE